MVGLLLCDGAAVAFCDRVCWDLAALRRGAGRRVPLPIRIACPTGKFQSCAGRADPHDGAPPGLIPNVRG